MKTTTILAALAATLLPASTLAQTAKVVNKCSFPVYVQSVPYDGSAAGPLTTLAPGTGTYTETYKASGATIKMGRARTLLKPLFFGYSTGTNPNNVYYEFSTQFGNPFAAFENTLSAGAGCKQFDCAANDASCYSTPAAKKVLACPLPASVTATLCG